MYTDKIYTYTDTFAYGMLVWECFSKRRVFADAHDADIPAMIKSGKRPELAMVSELIGGIPIRIIIAACWEHGT